MNRFSNWIPYIALLLLMASEVSIAETASQQSVQTSQTDELGVVFSPDGSRFATFGTDAVIEIWDAASLRKIQVLKGGSYDVSLGAFSHDNHKFATANSKWGIKIWDCEKATIEQTIPGRDESIEAIGFDSQDRQFAIAFGRSIAMWDLSLRKEAHLFRISDDERSIHPIIAFSPDGRWIAAGGSYELSVRIWELSSVREVLSLPAREIISLAFSPDGRWLATAEFEKDHPISLWELPAGQLHEYTAEHSDVDRNFRIDALSFSPDSRWLVSVDTFRKITKIWDVISGREMRALPYDGDFAALSPRADLFSSRNASSVLLWKAVTETQGTLLKTDTERLSAIASAQATECPDIPESDPNIKPELVLQTGNNPTNLVFSADGCRIASQDYDSHTVAIWEVSTGRQLFSFGTELDHEVTFSPNGKLLATAGSKIGGSGIEIWSMTTWQKVASLDANEATGLLEFDPTGKWLHWGSEIWEIPSGREIQITSNPSEEVRANAFSPDGKWLASAIKYQVDVWNLSTGERASSFTVGRSLVDAIEISPDGRLLAAHDGEVVKLWEFPGGKERFSAMAGPLRGVGKRSLAFSPDGHLLAFVTAKGVSLYDVVTGAETVGPEGFWEDYGLAFSQDGKSLIHGWMDHVAVWQIHGKTPPQSLGLSGALSPDGRRLASAQNNKISIHEVETGLEIRSFGGSASTIGSAEFTPDGRWLVLAGPDGAWFWDVVSGQPVQRLNAGGTLFFSPDGRWMFNDSEETFEKKHTLWSVPAGKKVREFPGFFLAFSSDGRWLATVGRGTQSWEQGIQVWDLENKREPISFRETADAGIFDPDGKWLFIWHNDAVMLLDLSSANVIYTSGLKKVVSPDGRWTALGGLAQNYSHVLKETKTGREFRTTNMVFETSRPLDREKRAVSRDGDIALAAKNNVTLVLDSKTKKEIARILMMEKSNDWVVITPEGLFDGTPEGMERLVAWRFGNHTMPLEAFLNEFFYPGLLSEILHGGRPAPQREFSKLDRRQPELRVRVAPTDITSPGAVSTRTIRLQVDVAEVPPDPQHTAGSGAQDVRLFRNGSLIKAWRGEVLQGKNSTILETTVSVVSGLNRFTAYAFNHDNIKSNDATLTVGGARSLARTGTAYVVAIGVNQYENPEFNLKYAVADAKAFSEELTRKQKDLGKFEKIEVAALLDQNATRKGILATFTRLADQVQPEDAVFVYFAGHGVARRNHFYLVPHDLGYSGIRSMLGAESMDIILGHSLSDLDLEKVFEPLDAGQFFLIIDACNSGQALEAEEKRRGPMNAKGLAQLAYEKGIFILTAAQGYQAALEAEQLGHGYLTYALVEEGLKTPAADSSPKDGDVTAREWLDYAVIRVPQMQDDKIRQSRRLQHEFAFVSDEEQKAPADERSLQRPRVFYKRERDPEPFILTSFSGADGKQ